ncbi:cyclic di-AMP binding protein CbpA [Lactiplantibacillus plantarum]|uniref:cyclic di-AMP binding protein CbpA n=1 Tax=Lactiplantibacillus plantarum TaxID=1590 RepID=UPI001AAF2DA3|nr:cyclic di-AMP binding protein CbpA [Lactiplantibacillus plantarum]MBO2728643.1 CBS domain-containing protein [Lactiplantibacillus plantarum]
MLLKTLVKPKERLVTITANATLEDALKVLEDSGFRCIPILDETGHIFRGNIYKMHIYRHKSRGGDMSLPVTTLLKNATKTIQVDSAFYNIFFSIKDLPYIAVLDEHGYFYGILTHTRLLDMLSQSWNVNVGSYVLTVVSVGERGDLAAMAKIITKYTSIAGCLTLDVQNGTLGYRTLFTLPENVDSEKLKRIIDNLNRKQFKVIEVEDLQAE